MTKNTRTRVFHNSVCGNCGASIWFCEKTNCFAAFRREKKVSFPQCQHFPLWKTFLRGLFDFLRFALLTRFSGHKRAEQTTGRHRRFYSFAVSCAQKFVFFSRYARSLAFLPAPGWGCRAFGGICLLRLHKTGIAGEDDVGEAFLKRPSPTPPLKNFA